MGPVTETWEAWESVDRPDLPVLGTWYLSGDQTYWDPEFRHSVDMEALAKAGYFRKVRITQTKEYI